MGRNGGRKRNAGELDNLRGYVQRNELDLSITREGVKSTAGTGTAALSSKLADVQSNIQKLASAQQQEVLIKQSLALLEKPQIEQAEAEQLASLLLQID